MELLPIIYWSLVGLGVLTLFVIITSYITYQIRKNLDKVSAANNKNDDLLRKVILKREVNKNNPIKHHPKVKRKHNLNDYKKSSFSSKNPQSSRITILNDKFRNEDLYN